LGLAIVKHIAQAHRGGVTAASEPGRGSTFTITLPREVRA
jgi:signal transduction histidine kinase